MIPVSAQHAFAIAASAPRTRTPRALARSRIVKRILALTLLCGLWLPAMTDAAEPASVAGPGTLAPALRLPDLQGRPQDLAQWRGQPLLINYWASWCGPCLKELPDLQRFATAQQGRNGVRVLGIAQDQAAAAAQLQQRLALTFPQLVEEDGPPGSAAAFGNRHGTLPFSVLLDAQGRILAVHNGPLQAADFERFAALAGERR